MFQNTGVRHPAASEVQQISRRLVNITEPDQQWRAQARNAGYKDLCAFEEFDLPSIAQRKLFSPDPQRPAILARLRWILPSLPVTMRWTAKRIGCFARQEFCLCVGSRASYAAGILRVIFGSHWIRIAHILANQEPTRQVMRELRLHRVSLSKGSPDDNPVENICSDAQLLILDNNNDPDTKTTQQRISVRLRGRNHRADRFVRIPCLLSQHFHSN
jgi:hypothetical protein